MTPADKLREAAEIWEERERQYGANYLRLGKAMAAFFPKGLRLDTAEDFARYHILTLSVAKMGRYAFNFDDGGHADSLSDISVYTAILGALDETAK